jgi:hypothetical protein
VVAGGFAFLAQYPRMDEYHLAWSTPVVLVVGAVALARLHAWLAARWRLGARGRPALAAALLVAPALAALPLPYDRLGQVVLRGDPATGLPAPIPLAPVPGAPALAGVRVPADQAAALADLVAAVRAATAPGEPIFVYPSSPLLYVAAERPNPTRFAHLYPGAATPAEVEQAVAALGAVRVVVVSDGWLTEWGPPGPNAPLEAYLGARFAQVGRFGEYRLLARREAAAEAA